MYKYLHRQLGLFANLLNLLQIILPSEHHTLHVEGFGELDGFWRGDRHLRRTMNREVRGDFADHFDQTQILNDNRIYARIDTSFNQFFGIG
ncbi:hypothetical protein D3C73_396770 [compost metagenome]